MDRVGTDDASAARGRRPDGIPQEGHAQADLRRAGVRRRGRCGRPGTAPRRCPATRDGPARGPASPARWISRRSPQMPVRIVAPSQKTRISDAHDGIGPPARVHRDERTRREAGHDHAAEVHRRAVVLQPGRHLGDLLAGEVGDRVEHVRARVEQEPAARELRDLAPRALGVGVPVLPGDGADVQDGARPRRCGSCARPRGCSATGCPGRRRRRGDRSGRASRSATVASAAFMTIGFSSRTSRPASRQADRLVVMQRVGRADEDRVERSRRSARGSAASRARWGAARGRAPRSRSRRWPRPQPRARTPRSPPCRRDRASSGGGGGPSAPHR